MLSQNSCVVVCVNVLGWGQVDVMSTQNSCVVVCVNVLGWGSTGGFDRFKFRLFFIDEFLSFYSRHISILPISIFVAAPRNCACMVLISLRNRRKRRRGRNSFPFHQPKREPSPFSNGRRNGLWTVTLQSESHPLLSFSFSPSPPSPPHASQLSITVPTGH